MAGISINILTKGRLNCLERLFAELVKERETISDIANEVNIIDDSEGSDKNTIEKWCEDFQFNYWFIKGGISKKRNAAVKVSNHEIVLFFDSDCYLNKDILWQHLALYNDPDVYSVLGVVEFVGEKPFFWKVIDNAGYTVPFSFSKFMDYAMWGPCANISFRKEALVSIGCFKEYYPFDYSGEDVDIGLRLNKSGYKIKCNSSAVVFHDTITWLNLFGFSKKIFRWGKTDYFLMKDHPELLFPEFPKFFLITILIALIPVCSDISYLIIPMFIFLTPLIDWLFRHLAKNKPHSKISVSFCSFFLKQIFEFGFIFQTIGFFQFKLLTKKLLYGQRQLEYEIRDRVFFSFTVFVSLILSLIIQSIFFK